MEQTDFQKTQTYETIQGEGNSSSTGVGKTSTFFVTTTCRSTTTVHHHHHYDRASIEDETMGREREREGGRDL